MLAVVLSGGGAKGAYEVGVWKALRKLRIKFNIVTGTSIGAINGFMMAQNDYRKCLKLWETINFDKLYDDFKYTENVKEIYKNYINKVLEGGIDTSKIKKIIDSNYRPYKLYRNNMQYGVISFNATERKPVISTTRNTRPSQLKKYILASATCFPVFKPTKIGQDNYIDGGYYDNLPLNLAIELGATEIIAVDLQALGLKKKMKSKDVKVTYIIPKRRLEAFFMFEPKAAKRMINLGYNDTMKVFNQYEGDVYTFKKRSMYSLNKLKGKLAVIANEYDNPSSFKKIDNKFVETIENTMELLELRMDAVYTYATCKAELLKSINKIDDINLTTFDIDEIKKVFDKKKLTKFFYTKIKKHDKINGMFMNIFSKEFIAAMYLVAMER